MSTEWHAAWSAALDRFEADIAAAEALLVDEHLLREVPVVDPWQPPEGLGPLPLDLRPRADEVLRRQFEVASRLSHAMASTAKQAAMLGRVGQRATPRPAYIDCAM